MSVIVSTEYVDDIPYIRQFVADLSPTRLRLVAGLNGLAPPPASDFDYCELGCAHGDTLAALAAAHPDARFLGVDLSAAHVASAKRLAREGALENVGVLQRDFADLVEEDIGPFDYVVAHGVLSWVSAEKRKALYDFAARKLKPGGLLHVSYNAMPGWAAVEPLRQLLLFGGVGETSLDRARSGLAFARSMQRAGAEYFAKNAEATEMLETMAKAGLPYVVHEYLHEHWTPMYFARVAWEMRANDLHFAGVLPIHANFRDTAVREPQEKLLADVTDRLTFESLKDFAINEFFRRDVYVKGSTSRSMEATDRYLDSTPWGTRRGELPDERAVRLPHRTVTLEGAAVEALFGALGEGASTLASLVEREDLAAEGPERLRGTLLRLIVADEVVPMCTTTRSERAHGDGTLSIPSVYNQMMLRRLVGEIPIVMASTVAGTAFPMSALQGLALRMLTEAPPSERERWVHEFVGHRVLRIRVGERVLENEDDQRRAVLDAAEHLRTRDLAKLVELGIVAAGRAE